ncbi:MAG: 5-(carboxyamino)imidazole ribonucleotide synthase [Cyanobacteria bacterium P01_F01_bin.150]
MSRVGVIGGGQLAWMMSEVALSLGIELCIQTPKLTDPAGKSIPPENIVLAAVDDANATAKMSQSCDVVTFENEFVDLDALSKLFQSGVTFYPAIASLRPLLDKYHQRQCFKSLHIPTPKFAVIEEGMSVKELMLGFLCHSEATPIDSAQPEGKYNFPVVLKARRHGYDGKGTHIIRSQDELTQILTEQADTPWLLEEFVPFERELAVMAARSQSGDIVVYPVVESQQEEQVCRRVFVGPEVDLAIQEQVEAIARKLLTYLNFVGVLGIEFFLTKERLVLVNEIAPRTHNSGHYTIDACVTSQFDQQLRAVTGLPLGNADLICEGAVMVNLLGYENSNDHYQHKRKQLGALPDTSVYWYGKAECRVGRKMAHVTTVIPKGSSCPAEELRKRLEAIASTIESLWYPSPY